MLESVLADVLTRVLGQYLQGIDRDHVNFGAWSGRIELRSVALRPEALAVLFETLGVALPVTVESGFIGLLRLVVPWKSIGSTPVQVYMHDVTVVARPVRGDGSDDSQLIVRDRRIKRAKLNTDDAVREASWGVSSEPDEPSKPSWSSWLVSDQLRATIINNIQIHLSDIIIRFEDPYSNPQSPYVASMHCESLKIVSADTNWHEAFVEDSKQKTIRKLLEIKGFQVNWAPITENSFLDRSNRDDSSASLSFDNHDLLREYVSYATVEDAAHPSPATPRDLIHRIDGSMHLCLSSTGSSINDLDFWLQEPSADIDIVLPNIVIDLNDVQYACLTQTSLYFARIATRGFRPITAKARWKWAVDQLLPGCTARFARYSRFTIEGLKKTRCQRDAYIVNRTSILKARRTKVEEPKQIVKEVERMEDAISFDEILAYRDAVDAQIEKEGHLWIQETDDQAPSEVSNHGTTTSSFWSMLGYKNSSSSPEKAKTPSKIQEEKLQNQDRKQRSKNMPHSSTQSVTSDQNGRTSLLMRAAFLLQSATLRMSEKGYPTSPVPRVELRLRDFRIGVLYSSAGDLIVEALLGTVEAWNLRKNIRMAYSRLATLDDFPVSGAYNSKTQNSYPRNVPEAIESIRNGSNPAEELLEDDVDMDQDMESRTFTENFPDDSDAGFGDSSAEARDSMGSLSLRSKKSGSGRFGAPSTHRVTSSEFLGSSNNWTAGKHVAAFRYSQLYDHGGPSKPKASFEISVATLEAIVDGPKGSFLWGLKFWQPKGLIQDPIMAFLGAAAGARIAELRIELEQAILATSVPLQVDAVILAPRFIIPSSVQTAPAIVVNMGTLGICTSDNAPHVHGFVGNAEPKYLRYANYVLTLDDLGVYFSPDLQTAVPHLNSERDPNALEQSRSNEMWAVNGMNGIERIIRPFSLRFVLQTLRDPKAVQVAQSTSTDDTLSGEGIAKLRVRGSIPDLSLILTQKAFQHILATTQGWSEGLKPSASSSKSSSSIVSKPKAWENVGEDGVTPAPSQEVIEGVNALTSVISPPKDANNDKAGSTRPSFPTLASYSVKIVVDMISVELRESMDVRLVTATASGLRANVSKRNRNNLHADLSLGNWSITDGSRGSTAPFRSLLYSGTTSADGASSLHSSLHGDKQSQFSSTSRENFVNIRYDLDLTSYEQRLYFHFLSLHMNCVRESFLRLLSFFDRVRKYVSQRRRRRQQQTHNSDSPQESDKVSASTEIQSTNTEEISHTVERGSSKMLVLSEFDGFSIQLVASKGVVAVFEVKDSDINFIRESNGAKKAYGKFGSFSVRDLTAPLQEHVTVLRYERTKPLLEAVEELNDDSQELVESKKDKWDFQFPSQPTETYQLKASFNGLKLLVLYRFAEVLQDYVSAFVERVSPVLSSFVEDAKAEYPGSEKLMSSATYSSISSKIVVSIDLRNISLRIPRHSSCLSEAVSFAFGKLHIDNTKARQDSVWFASVDDMQGTVQFILGQDKDMGSETSASSAFLTDGCLEVFTKAEENSEVGSMSPDILKIASVHFQRPLRINLTEAQYTVLYFVLTENAAETISSDNVSVTLDDFQSSTNETECEAELVISEPDNIVGKSRKSTKTDVSLNRGDDTGSDVVDPDTDIEVCANAIKVEVIIPLLDLEILRGWDVTQSSHRVLGLNLANVACGLSVYTPRRLLFEFAGTVLSVSDLRQEANPIGRNMIVRLSPHDDVESEANASDICGDNILLTYDKKGTERPSIVVALNSLQIEVIPELLRDLTCLAIPGWPFLKTSAFAPEVEYVGRVVTIALKNSQFILVSEVSSSDKRALVLTGEFEVKMDWKRKTGGKTILLQSRGFEVSAVGEVPSLRKVPHGDMDKNFYALSFGTSSSPLIYPTNNSIECVSPIVDDGGYRMNIAMDALLCVVCTSDIPILKAILNRLSSLKESRLSRRQWLQPMFGPENQLEVVHPKEEQKRKAQESLNLSISIPVSRYLVTDDNGGRFVPIIEMRFSSLSIETHGSDMFQIDSQVAMDLFNPTKGWWEPVLEPWNISASLSRGQSGTRAFILKSEERLNLNIAPTTVTSAKTVAKVLREATGKSTFSKKSSFLVESLTEREELKMNSTVRRPTVAAFLVRNELGYPIMMSVSRRSKWTTIASNCEIEVGAQSEAILSSSNEEKRSREDVLQCFISIPSFGTQVLSAAEAGKHTVKFYPKDTGHDVHQSLSNVNRSGNPIEVLWDVELRNGVPVCTLRSPFRVLNDTNLTLDIFVANVENTSESLNSVTNFITLSPGEHFPVPINDLTGKIHVRPAISVGIDASSNFKTLRRPFQWSTAFPRLPWLLTLAQEKKLAFQQSDMKNMRHGNTKIPLIECKPCENDGYALFFKLSPTTSEIRNIRAHLPWLDISVKAPVSFVNKLPRRLLYRVFRKNRSSPGATGDEESAILAAGKIDPLKRADLYFSDESFHTTFLSMAYDNDIAWDLFRSAQVETSQEFGPSICLKEVEVKKLNVYYPFQGAPQNSQGQSRKRFGINVEMLQDDVSEFLFFAYAWVRNRSDTAIEVCSRRSTYNPGSVPIILRERPPFAEPDDYVCLEGPYLSVRLNDTREVEGNDRNQSDWWTSPSILEDIEKPISFFLPGRSLELEVRPSIGLECQTLIVIIRNLSWIINSTPSYLQWCQQASLDAHGNCPKRLLNSIRPGEIQGLHWNAKTNSRALHLRIANDDEDSDWIWSPPVPLDVGHSRELPAKMYRPKTHDQYIARVSSKETAGNSRVLIVYDEDRHNPPYRIVNMCKERALAFSQVGSRDRPWLVRAGKSSRYSWDDPLAPPNRRELNIRVLEKEELLGKISPSVARNSQSASGKRSSTNLNIDKVGNKVLVLNDAYVPPVVFNVTVDGATKIITLFDEGSDVDISLSPQLQVSPSPVNLDDAATRSDNKASVPVVGWDDMDSHTCSSSSSKEHPSDYPSLPSKDDLFANIEANAKTDTAVFLDSIGISIIDKTPEEIMYLTMSGLFLNYETSKEEQNVLLTIEQFQIDNQTTKTPYPVMLWVPTAERKTDTSEPADNHEVAPNALTVELHRDIAKQDIIMVRTFRALFRPCSICFEEGLINKTLQFLADSAISGESQNAEKLGGIDDEGQTFKSLIPDSSAKSGRRESSIPSSKRIYVHNFQIAPTAVQLTSSGNGAAIAKAAGLSASVRAVVGLLMNVENCQFDFPSLCVQNAFDSLHHFGVLVRAYYVTQLSNQRLKLIASNSLVGNPAALFDAVGTGARDFFAEPGRAKGSVDFFASVGRGSKSLFTHTVGGLVQSVSSIPRAMSSGIERAVGDNDYLAERDRIRGSTLISGQRGMSRNPAQGFATGALSLAHGISSGVTGFIRDPVQGAKQGGAGGLLKGIGKAFIGGVAKPVAGAMDFVAEPVAGLSRQIVDVEQLKGMKMAAPSRAPRAFKGKSQRIDQYDRSYSIGVWLLKATSMASGMNICSKLIDWIELSNRPGRKQEDADLWIWRIVQRFSRCMPGAKKSIRSELKGLVYDQDGNSQKVMRPEKTRVALVTDEDIVIVTLDCKLVTIIPIWNDAVFELVVDDKELIIGTTILNSSLTDAADASNLLQGAQSLIHAPWDVATVRRRKPAAGESTIDHIACGSVEACEDLRILLMDVIQEKEASRESCKQNKTSPDPRSSGQELSETSEWHGDNNLEMKIPRPSKDWKMREGNRREETNTANNAERTLESLQNAIKRLSENNNGVRRAKSSARILRIIVANELVDDVELRLKEGSLECGEWRKDAPVLIKSLDAEVMEMNGSNATDSEHALSGNVVYRVVKESGEIELGQVMVEFFWDRDAATSFTTKASKGFRVEFERGGMSQGSVVFKIRRSVEGESEPGRGSIVGNQSSRTGGQDKGSTEKGRNEGSSAISRDERLLQQLMDIGFSYENSIEALAEAQGDIVRAVDLLTK